jgi:hypothetical protein
VSGQLQRLINTFKAKELDLLIACHEDEAERLAP